MPDDAHDLALRLGALIDGLAIQVLMNDSDVTPARMREVCMEVAARGSASSRPRPSRPRRGPDQPTSGSTPRLNSCAAMMLRWISLVPSQMRSTRPVEALDVLAHVAAAAEDLDGPVGDAARHLAPRTASPSSSRRAAPPSTSSSTTQSSPIGHRGGRPRAP